LGICSSKSRLQQLWKRKDADSAAAAAAAAATACDSIAFDTRGFREQDAGLRFQN
jgi:hypothetical protein